MVKVTFEYRDTLSRGRWNTQSCIVSDVEQCKKIYGLDTDPDCEYRIIEVEEVHYGTV